MKIKQKKNNTIYQKYTYGGNKTNRNNMIMNRLTKA